MLSNAIVSEFLVGWLRPVIARCQDSTAFEPCPRAEGYTPWKLERHFAEPHTDVTAGNRVCVNGRTPHVPSRGRRSRKVAQRGDLYNLRPISPKAQRKGHNHTNGRNGENDRRLPRRNVRGVATESGSSATRVRLLTASDLGGPSKKTGSQFQ